MPTPFKKIACLTLLLLPLTLIQPLYAQNNDASPPSGSEAEFNEPEMERQEVREEMQRIRAEHEDLETQHDLLKTQCMNAKGQDHQQCQQKWRELNEQKEALHLRMKVLHEKIEALRTEHRNEHQAVNAKSDHAVSLNEPGPNAAGNQIAVPALVTPQPNH